jgi:hypothetical protein
MYLDITLTPAAIKKFRETKPKLTLMNGNYHFVELDITNNKKRFTLQLSDTHDILREFCGIQKEEIRFVVWDSLHCGTVHEGYPEALRDVVEKMRPLALMTDEQAAGIRAKTIKAIAEFNDQF